MFRVVRRGTFDHIFNADGSDVVCRVYRALLQSAFVKNGKTYVVLDTTRAIGDTLLVCHVDEFVRQRHPRAYRAATRDSMVVKAHDTAWLDEDGDPLPPTAPRDFGVFKDTYVDVVVTPGAFGSFGYCWLLDAIKPHRSRSAHMPKPKP